MQSTDPRHPPPACRARSRRRPAGENSQGDIVITGTLIQNPNLVASCAGHVDRRGGNPASARPTSPKSFCASFRARFRASVRPSTTARAALPTSTFAASATYRNIVLLDGHAHRSVRAGRPGQPQQHPARSGPAGRRADRRRVHHLRRRRRVGRRQLHHPPRLRRHGARRLLDQITEQGDGHTFRADLTLGANFDDGRGNVVLSLGYGEADPVYQGARRISRQQVYLDHRRAAGGSGTAVPTRFTVLGAAASTQQLNPASTALWSRRTRLQLQPVQHLPDAVRALQHLRRRPLRGVGRHRSLHPRPVLEDHASPRSSLRRASSAQLLDDPRQQPVSAGRGARDQFCANERPGRLPTAPAPRRITPAQCAAAATATGPTDPNYRAFTIDGRRRTTELGPRLCDYMTNRCSTIAPASVWHHRHDRSRRVGRLWRIPERAEPAGLHAHLALPQGRLHDQHDDL